MDEKYIQDGMISSNNFAHGYAKRMADIQIQAYQQQYKINNYCSIIPGGIFGPNDTYDIEYGRVIPSLIYKTYLAKHDKSKKLSVWGDGTTKHDFIYVDDLTHIVYQLLQLDNVPPRIIVSSNKQHTIKDIVNHLRKISNLDSETCWDTTKPHGKNICPSNTSLLKSLLPDFKFTDINEALKLSYDWFVENYPNVRK